ncbi:hypothetical protein JCM17846_33570 [Iodidimonas nitroreducens]|uniref:Ion transport domain-containing protein n=1 Tax=Iodidimonas nitroreducens TaxID=1236968 RepID=A0A5A7NDH4_9PROT|nr:ion transporter [Iodidimonas nitroreducens]GAK34428.1 potassium voltage-gated channel subfamily B member 2 [alpha proteobacterium Q-1]GER05675.1 hypothetical protein JCM17846_33570 [Iodidimonas nitroreducens]
MAVREESETADGVVTRVRPFLRLKAVIERRDSRAGRLFDGGIQFLIILNLIAFSIDTLPSIPENLRITLAGFEIFSIVIFTLEYLTRLLVADSRPRFIFSFFGLVDLAATLPFYLAFGMDLRAIRALRLLRLLKLLRYGPAINRFHRAFFIARDELILFGTAAMIVLFLAATGIYFFENEAQPEAFQSVFHALWWAVATLTTVGYGDVYPVTVGGRVFTAFVVIVGLGIVAVPTGLFASALSKARAEEDEAKRRK